MERRDLVGFNKKLFVVGKFKDKLLRMGETLSILILAPPGTGKSVGFIVPSIVSLDDCSIFVHDQKPELWDITSNYRSTIGPCFQLKWAAQDEPNGKWVTPDEAKLLSEDLIEKDKDGKTVINEISGSVKTKPIYYPSWNPLSPKSIPGYGPKREMYIERLANVLCPDPVGGGDKFWTSKARAALTGLSHFLVAKVEAANDPKMNGDWTGIPDNWHGREASFPMLVDWFAHAQTAFDDGSEDPMRTLFRTAIEEAKALDNRFDEIYDIRPMNRAVIEMTGLMNSPDKTRGSILTTMDEALNPFKNEAVRQRTSSCDFAFHELRGIPVQEARDREREKVKQYREQGIDYKPRYQRDEWEPVSIYISVNLEDAKALAVITGIFIDSANAYLVANGPNAIDEQGNQLGPCDFGFLADETPQLPKLDTVINGPAVGRSKRVFYVLVGQDFGQIEQKYSKAEVETLKTNTAIKIILAQNNETTAKIVSEMAGKITYTKESLSDRSGGNNSLTKGIQEIVKIRKKSSSQSMESTEFLKQSFIMSMPEGKHLVFVQNYTNRPIMCDTPRFFEMPEFKEKTFNLRSLEGPRPAPPMPFEIMEEAAARKQTHKKKKKSSDGSVQEGGEATVGSDGRVEDDRHRFVFIATPRDIQALTRNQLGEMSSKGNLFCLAELNILPDAYFCDPPPESERFVTDDVTEVADYVRGSRFVVFDEATLEEEVNKKLSAAGRMPLNKARADFIDKRAGGVGESAGDDIYFLGYEGGPSLDLPENKDQVTPEFAVSWIVEIISFILGVEDQKRLFED